MRKLRIRRLSTVSIAVTCCMIVLSISEPTRAFAPAAITSFQSSFCLGSLSAAKLLADGAPEGTPSIRISHPSPRRRRKTRTILWSERIQHKSPVLKSRTRGNNNYNTAIFSAWLALFILFIPVQAAHAGFGPSGGATTSPTPGVLKVNVQDLSGKKLQQLIDSTIDENRLNEFKSQLDTIIDNVASTLNQPGTSDDEEDEAAAAAAAAASTITTERDGGDGPIARVVKKSTILPKFDSSGGGEERLEKARSFQTQISNRERILDKLEAQPKWFNFFAAFCGSVASTLVMHPLDTIKTRLQVTKANATTSTTNTTMEDSGLFTNLYEGLTGNILKEGPPSALYLGVYEAVKSSLIRGKLAPIWASLLGASSSSVVGVQNIVTADPTYLLSIYLVAGAAGEIVGSTIRAPAEAIKGVVQVQKASTTAEAFEMVLLRPEGRSNVFRAWSASALRDVPFGAIQLALFELIKAFILNNPNIDFDSSTLQSEAIIGAFAGGTGAFVTNPMDVITTRIITQSTNDDEGGEYEPLGATGMGRLILEEGGVGALFAGWQARVLYWAPAISIFLTCYCSVRQLGVKLDLFG